MSHVRAVEFEDASAVRGRLRIAVKLLGNKQRIAILVLTLGRITVGFCDLAVAAAMYLLFLLLQGRSPSHNLLWIPKTTLSAAVITSLLVVLRAFLDLYSARSLIRQIQKLYTELLLRMTNGYNEMRWARFVRCNRGDLSNHALYSVREAAEFYQRCIELAASVVIVLSMAAALVYESLIAACAFAVALGAFYCVHRLFIRSRLQQASERRETAQRTLQRSLTDIFSAAKEIRTYGNQGFFLGRIQAQAQSIATSNLRTKYLPQIAGSIADQGAVLLFLCIIITVQLRHSDPRQLLSLLAFYFVLSRRLIPLINQISNISGQMETSYENVRIVSAELDECQKHRAFRLPAALPADGLAARLRDISFSFRGSVPILSNVDLSLREGEIAVLQGPSGTGKSCLLNLIAGVCDPTSGVVEVNRDSIAYVPQEICLLDDSIRSNLLFGLPATSDDKLMAALKTVQLGDFVAAQPLGLDTVVGDNGALLSGGQRQRVGLARAILREPELLLLDEATSALDAENERRILENLRVSGKTIVLVTHRVLTNFASHRIFRLHQGRLVEDSLTPVPVEEHAIGVGMEI